MNVWDEKTIDGLGGVTQKIRIYDYGSEAPSLGFQRILNLVMVQMLFSFLFWLGWNIHLITSLNPKLIMQILPTIQEENDWVM